MLQVIRAHFNVTLWLLVVPVLVIVMVARRMFRAVFQDHGLHPKNLSRAEEPQLFLELLRFKEMLLWITQSVQHTLELVKILFPRLETVMSIETEHLIELTGGRGDGATRRRAKKRGKKARPLAVSPHLRVMDESGRPRFFQTLPKTGK